LLLSHYGIARALIERAGPLDSLRGRELLDEVAVAGLAAVRSSLNGDARAAAFLDVALRPGGGPALLSNLGALAREALPGALPAIDELSGIAAALLASGRLVEVDLGMVRDFEYYTGAVFEFAAEGESWGGGGRYTSSDGLSGCGLGLDLSRLTRKLAASTAHRPVVAIIPGDAADIPPALDAARALHRSGIAAALSAEATGGAIAVIVRGGALFARTPDGERAIGDLDEVVALLIQHK
jgi:ATP phosphoribosyltransferase regulatory subunit HisZ